MTPRFDNYIFDFDGTLCDSQEGIYNCVAYALDKMGEPPISAETARRFIGPALFLSFQDVTGMDEQRAETAVRLYRERYIPVGVYECALYPGILDMLTRLKAAGVTLTMASAKPEPSVIRASRHLGIDGLFSKIVGAPPDVKRNEKDGYIVSARAGESPLMIGDSPFDVLSARRVGIPAAAVGYGFFPAGELSALKPEYLFNSVAELDSFLLKSIKP